MRLNSWQSLILGLPFIIGGIVYLFGHDIVKNMHLLFPEYQEQAISITLSKKVATYLDIEKKSNYYREIEDKLAARRSNATWITENILYSKHEIVKQEVEEIQKRAWKLEMVYPKKNIAIINGKLVGLNDMVDGAKVVDIENLRVLLKHNERLEWVTLFQ